MTARLYPSRPFLAASIAVFRDGRILLASRAKPPAAHLFSLPGGVVEVGETLRAAALRELHEEVGVRADIVAFNDHVEIIEPDAAGRVRHHFIVASFVARWTHGEIVASPEVERGLWADPENLGDLRLTAGLKPLIRRAHRLVADAR